MSTVCACCHENPHSSVEYRLDQWLDWADNPTNSGTEWMHTLCSVHDIELAAALLRRDAR